MLFNTCQLLVIREGIVVISVLVYLGEEGVQKVNVAGSVIVQCISFVRWLITKKEFRVNQIHYMTLSIISVFLHRCLIDLYEIESFMFIMLIDDTFKSISAATEFL